jgi:two-component system, NtrC family, nitrogen regulation sensor histidine kinase NtrY
MAYNKFSLYVTLRVMLIAMTIILIVYLAFFSEKYITMTLVGLILIYQIYALNNYVAVTNRKLSRFLESIQYADFSAGFNKDIKLNNSFEELNTAFSSVINAFQKIRMEGEENLRYLDTVVQHVGTGLLAIDGHGKVELINNASKKILGLPYLQNINHLPASLSMLKESFLSLKPGEGAINKVSIGDNEQQVVVNATEFKMRGKVFKLITIQNIQQELDNKELEAWQNLTRVLRHEIMNSVTPISSLSSFAVNLLESEWQDRTKASEITVETLEDLHESLKTIERRCAGLIQFVNGYRHFSRIPTPEFQVFQVKEFLQRVVQLMQAETSKTNQQLKLIVEPEDLSLDADPVLLEMVLINLVKNAFEALENQADPQVLLKAYVDHNNKINIQVEDNGPGIAPEAMEKVFIPFFTTKKGGSGIGLSWSRQIMNLHKGSISVQSIPNQMTSFTLRF